MDGPAVEGSVDFFISYAGPDRPWAEWVAQQLTAAGYTVELDVWDWVAGSNVVLNMNDALVRARRVVALFSAAYFQRDRFTLDEWTAVLARRPDVEGRRRLVPLRIEDVEPPPILAALVVRDLYGLDELRAREELLAGLSGAGRPPTSPFPGTPSSAEGARVPGSYPSIWNVPRRHPGFTGREAALAELRGRLTAEARPVVQALHGMGGVGKTQLAIEYAHLFASEYELVWWVDAERPELIGEQLSALGVSAGWAGSSASIDLAVRVTMQRLRARSNWLIIFDNVRSPEEIHPWLPPDTGQIVVTTRGNTFQQLGRNLELDVLSRPESIDLIRFYAKSLSDEDADAVAEQLGDLPLALAQAGATMNETAMPAREYIAELASHSSAVLAARKPLTYPVSLAAAIEVSVSGLARSDGSAAHLLALCAHLAPEPVPLDWFAAAPGPVLGEPLGRAVTDRLQFRQLLGRIAGFGLARVGTDTILLHRLTAAVVRDINATAAAGLRSSAERVLAGARPDSDESSPESWPQWAYLMPHLLHLDPGGADEQLRGLACDSMWYLLARGEYRNGLALAGSWHARWVQRFGPDNRQVLRAATVLAGLYWRVGQFQPAYLHSDDAVTRCRRLFGPDDPDTLRAEISHANVLFKLRREDEAGRIGEDALGRSRRLNGPDHPRSLEAAQNLAVFWIFVGHRQQALDLLRDTLDRRNRVSGEDDANTLMVANNLATTMQSDGDVAAARTLLQDTNIRQRRVLGVDHPNTLRSANNLATCLYWSGEYEDARAMQEELLVAARAALGENDELTLGIAINLGATLRALGDLHGARAVHEDALKRQLETFRDHHEATVEAADELAVDLLRMKQHDEAFQVLTENLARCRSAFGENHNLTRRARKRLDDLAPAVRKRKWF